MIALIFNGDDKMEIIAHITMLDLDKKYKVTVEEYAPVDEELVDRLDEASGD